MNRSTGATLSAVLVFLGSALTLCFGLLMVFGSLALRQQQPQIAAMRYILYGVDAVYVALAVWGIASGVGLLRLREWDRVSMIVFSLLLLLCTLPALLFLVFMPNTMPAHTSPTFVLIFKLMSGAFEGFLVALSAAWLWFFNRGAVRSQFRRNAAAVDAVATLESARPLSISIIGWILIIGSAFGGIGLLMMLKLHFPMFLAGYTVKGEPGVSVVLLWSIAQFVAGVGLLGMKRWGWLLAIGTLSLGALNELLMLIPGSQTRLQEFTAQLTQRLGLPTPGMPVQTGGFFWLGFLIGLAFVGVQLWFLIIRKAAFDANNNTVLPAD